MTDVPSDLNAASHEQLVALIQEVLAENAELKREVAALRDEVARLKGKPPRPDIKPSGMAEKATGSGEGAEKSNGSPDKKRRRGSKRNRLTIDEDRTIRANVPAGSRFKGYEDYVTQDLEIRARTIRYRRERWETPDGETVTAALPDDVTGHYGAELRRFALALYHRGQMTIPRLTAQLHDLGIDIDQRQVRRLLTEKRGVFSTTPRPSCAPVWRRRHGSARTTPAPGTGHATGSAPRSATTASRPSPRRPPRAA